MESSGNPMGPPCGAWGRWAPLAPWVSWVHFKWILLFRMLFMLCNDHVLGCVRRLIIPSVIPAIITLPISWHLAPLSIIHLLGVVHPPFERLFAVWQQLSLMLTPHLAACLAIRNYLRRADDRFSKFSALTATTSNTIFVRLLGRKRELGLTLCTFFDDAFDFGLASFLPMVLLL